jgi:hypothetical protein
MQDEYLEILDQCVTRVKALHVKKFSKEINRNSASKGATSYETLTKGIDSSLLDRMMKEHNLSSEDVHKDGSVTKEEEVDDGDDDRFSVETSKASSYSVSKVSIVKCGMLKYII